jgi:osmotically-inducible protein OsmY
MILVLLLSILLPGCRTNESPEAQVDDLKIQTQVKSKLVSEIGLDSIPNIAVNSTNGIVTLSGQVNTPEIKAKAETVAKSVDKVVRVVNVLQVVAKPDVKSD